MKLTRLMEFVMKKKNDQPPLQGLQRRLQRWAAGLLLHWLAVLLLLLLLLLLM